MRNQLVERQLREPPPAATSSWAQPVSYKESRKRFQECWQRSIGVGPSVVAEFDAIYNQVMVDKYKYELQPIVVPRPREVSKRFSTFGFEAHDFGDAYRLTYNILC